MGVLQCQGQGQNVAALAEGLFFLAYWELGIEHGRYPCLVVGLRAQAQSLALGGLSLKKLSSVHIDVEQFEPPFTNAWNSHTVSAERISVWQLHVRTLTIK